jgi:hypothetical protein
MPPDATVFVCYVGHCFLYTFFFFFLNLNIYKKLSFTLIMKASHLSQNAFFEKKVGEEVRRMRRVGTTKNGSILAFGEPTWGEISVDLSADVNEIFYETPDVPSDLLRMTEKFKADKYWQFFFIFLHFRQALVTFVDESGVPPGFLLLNKIRAKERWR